MPGLNLKFVDSIAASPGTLLDLNDWATWAVDPECARNGFPPPEMRRAVTSSMMRNGDYIAYGSHANREIKLILNLQATGGTADNAATAIQNLARILDRQMSILRYQPSGLTAPVFFRTFRASYDAIYWDTARKQLTVTVPAEPYAIGLREDIATATVNNDPAAGTNGCFLDLTGIKGDVSTPLFIEYADGAAGLTRSGLAIGVRWGSSPYPNRFYQAESMNQSVDTSVVADATFSGGSKSRCTFATQSQMQLRLSAGFPSLTVPAGAENWGTYRVFARVAQTVAGDVISMRARTMGVGNLAVTLKSQTQPQLVDLGPLDATAGLTTQGGYSGADYRIESQDAIAIDAQRVSGTGSLDIDYLLFLPADEAFGAWSAFPDVSTSARVVVVDGPNESVYIATALSGATPGRVRGSNVGVTGGLPVVMPGNNRLVIAEANRGGATPASNLLATSFSVTCRYWPRYLHVRPATT